MCLLLENTFSNNKKTAMMKNHLESIDSDKKILIS